MQFVWLMIGLVAALSTGTVVLFMLGTAFAVLATLGVLLLSVYAARSPQESRPASRTGLFGLLVVSLALVVYGGLRLGRAFSDVSGPVEPADSEQLAAANTKIDRDVGQKAGFRLELTEEELTALVQDGLDQARAPFRRVEFDIVAGEGDGGHIDVEAAFRNGDLTFQGRFSVRSELGRLRFALEEGNLGTINVPGVADETIEDLVNPIADRALDEAGAEVQSVRLTDSKLIVMGTQTDGQLLTGQDLLADLPRRPPSSVSPPQEQIGPGTVNGHRAEGSPYYVALGDSLAANVGVAEARLGYVSRFHKVLCQRDDRQYGLRNFAVSGETSASLIRGSQLTEALAFIRAHKVRYITLDVGANDLLGHLASADCSRGVAAPACRERIEQTLPVYRQNLERIFARLREAAPQATILFLQTYNPFSLGLGTHLSFEKRSNQAISRLNALAAEAAQQHAIRVADGFSPMKGKAAVTTHILDNPPDVHPRAIGYDVLALALVEALS